jgi:hypothetical protein
MQGGPAGRPEMRQRGQRKFKSQSRSGLSTAQLFDRAAALISDADAPYFLRNVRAK